MDPGTNLGCHLGVHYAFARSKGKYVVKLDDDIIVPRNDWLAAMQRALRDFPDLAYVSLPWSPIRTGLYRSVAQHGYRLELFPTRIYSSCQMMRRELWARHFSREGRRALYATFEGDYFEISSRLGMKRGYLVSHPVRHLGRSNQTDLLYGVWKILYARGITRRDLVGWRKDFKLTPQEYSYLKQWGYSERQLEQVKAEIGRLSRPAPKQR
ncbi:hypothetical protein SY88_22425 [Clostridiales bacterium PH28_bin88]|nr:hypothetical protein SY88_22425 [Clostridiales bacterium PH28_bin88]